MTLLARSAHWLFVVITLAAGCAGQASMPKALPGCAVTGPYAQSGQERACAADQPEVAARMRPLQEERARLHVGRKIAFAAISAGIAVAGVSLLFESLALHLEGCHTGSASAGLHSPFSDCTARDAAFPVAMTGVGFVVVGGVLLGVSLPRMFSTLRRNKELGRELKALRSPQLSLGGPAGPFGLSLRGSF